ncbi:nitrogenase vanadium-iron protein alpha chain [Oxobacter pfennigii]|uniref:Nitrogenase vanadium-iron protein alpha chain n=1 Tax=Oxobacter pfennigii TaxID=36849 RepID=A0A0P8WLM6_9CLOT|nr:nitrogenase component 1 [Oxobacter pfennigii]KPU43345.1 nitrogenase vanadium-iron protein alpha chain [Oxobacter pfennigii]
MTFYSENISPDNLTGAVFAIEGIKDACVILNGPTGCKFYHSAVSDSQYLRSLSFDPLEYSEDFYFGQPRVPSTYLDSHDYVFGSGEKLTAILRSVTKKNFKLIAVINSPGAALIGDDLEKFLQQEVSGIYCFSMENTGYSGSFGVGYQNAIMKVMDTITMCPKSTRKKTVNLIGLCIYQKYFESNYKAIEALLNLCGIEVISALGATDSVETITHAPEAQLNVVLYPEYGMKIAEKFKAEYEIPYIVPDEGPPIGFDAAEAFIRQVCIALDANPEKAIEVIERARARAYLFLARYSSLLGLPKGSLFSVKAEASVAYALTKWLCTYLGMIPAAVSILPEADTSFNIKLKDFLTGISYEEVLDRPIIETPTHMLFADGSTISQLKLNDDTFCGVEIAMPTLGYVDVTEKFLFGERGALFLLEQVINGLRFI